MKQNWIESMVYSDEELLEYMNKFFKDNDQLPPMQTIADHFGVAINGVGERIRKLEKRGYFTRNSINKIMFARSWRP